MSNSSPALPPNPSLVAILLVIRTRSGQPHLVFHYPHSPSLASTSQTAPPAHASWYGGASTGVDGDESSTEQSSDSDDDASTLGSHVGSETDREEEKRSRSGSWKSKRDGSKHHAGTSIPPRGSRREVDDELENGSGDDDDEDRSPSGHGGGLNMDESSFRPDWERVLGFHVDALSKLLTPTRTFNKKRFEIGIDSLVFLGCPMFAKEDGTWTKHKRQKTTSGMDFLEPKTDNVVDAPDDSKQYENGSAAAAHPSSSHVDIDTISGFESGYGHGLDSGAASALASGAASEVTSISEAVMQLSMFHVVFVLNPPALEYHVRVDDMYDFVTKKLARYLKHEQARRSTLLDECVTIMGLKERARENRTPAYLLWPKIAAASSLANALIHVFDAVSESKIAHVHLDKSLDKAFQIPRPEFTPYMSTATEPQVPGLWLTTPPFADEDDADSLLNPHSALLLLEDEETLIKDIEHDDKALIGPLTWFIRNTTPTKSLQKQFHNTSAALLFKDSLFLARHLIYWRRARAIPPLHHRDTYLVSPNADMRALSAAIPAFAARFPTLPSLPKILERLSGTPRPYYTLMPSKDHRQTYMEILAWLMRGGWITQLKSFAWISVSTRVKQEVRKIMAAEAAEARPRGRLGTDSESSELTELPTIALGHRSTETESSIAWTISPSASSAPSPRLTAYRSPSHPASEAGSINSERTAVPYRPTSPPSPQQHNVPIRPSPLHMEHQPSPDVEKPEPVPDTGSMRSDSTKSVVLTDTDISTSSIIQSPQKANALESRWIEHIGASFIDQELTELWPVMLKYFDGKHALDEIALREGIKRKTVASVILRLRDAGLLLTVRHW